MKAERKIKNLKLTVLGQSQDIIKELEKTHLSLQGNFSNDLITIEDSNIFSNHLNNYIEKCSENEVSSRTGWISSLDHGVKKTTPEANIHQFIEKIRTKLS